MSNKKQSLKSVYDHNKKQVLWLTGTTEEQYFSFMTETAFSWLEHYYKNIININALIESDMFLQWWKAHWYLRDDRMFLNLLYRDAPHLRYMKYRQYHQYVFDCKMPETINTQKDFRAMRSNFERAIAKPVAAIV